MQPDLKKERFLFPASSLRKTSSGRNRYLMNIQNTKEGGAQSGVLPGLYTLTEQLERHNLPSRMYNDVSLRTLSTHSFHTSEGSQLKYDREVDTLLFSVDGVGRE